MTSPEARHWRLDPAIDFLNHGSFGACPTAVLARQQELRDELERQPVQFMTRALEPLLDAARQALADFVGADSDGLVFVPNATTGVNTVLQSLRFEPGDELLTTDHVYPACRNALERIAAQSGARLVVAHVPFPIDSASQVVDAVLGSVTPRTRLALVDHVTSSTGLVWPVETLVPALEDRGVATLVDGAHAPGMLPLDVRALNAAWYTGNCHKWLCAPKGAAFLWARPDRREHLVPLVTSHGASATRADRSRLHLEFDWTGTQDPTAYLAVPAALETMRAMVPGGWTEIRTRNRELALEARRMLCAALGIALPAPDSMIGSLAAVPLPPGDPHPAVLPGWLDPLQQALVERHRIEIPIIPHPAPPHRLVRISAQLYNEPVQYERLARALAELLGGSTSAGKPGGEA